MRKIIVLSCLLLAYVTMHAQKNHLGVFGDAGIPVGDFGDLYKMGFGGKLKFFYSLKNENELTAVTGMSFYSIKLRYTTDDETTKYRVIPLMLGYRHHFNNFFIEPQAGIGHYQLRHEDKNETMVMWHTAFTSAVMFGYLRNGYEMNIRYQTGLKKNDNVSLISLSAGYQFSL
jgi:hypothetical protein